MEALLVEFESALKLDRVMEKFRERAGAYLGTEGLVQKLYLRDPANGRVGGLYLFDTAANLKKFRDSKPEARIADAYQAKHGVTTQTFEVLMTLRPELEHVI